MCSLVMKEYTDRLIYYDRQKKENCFLPQKEFDCLTRTKIDCIQKDLLFTSRIPIGTFQSMFTYLCEGAAQF